MPQQILYFISSVLKGSTNILFENDDEVVSLAREMESISCSTPEIAYHFSIEKQWVYWSHLIGAI